MIKQKRIRKITALGKRRVDLFKLQERVASLEKQANYQYRINANHQQLRQLDVITTEEILARLSHLERIVLPEKQGVLKKALNRFWAWLKR